MADIANQLEGATGGLERFLEALDDSSIKLGSNAAIESKLARLAHKKAAQDIRFRKTLDKLELNHAKQLKAMQPLRQKLFKGIKDEIKSKADLLKQTKGLGTALKKTGAGLGSMFKSLGKSISSAMKGLGDGFKGGIQAGLKGIWDNLKEIEILGISVGKIIGLMAAGAKTLYDVMTTHEKLMRDITVQTGLMGKTFKEQYRNEIIGAYGDLGRYGYKLKETVKLTQDLREAFGDVSYVTNDLVKTSAQLQIVYRMATDDANELVETMTRSGYEGKNFLKTMEKTAIVMGADVGMAMRDVAKNTQLIELYAGRGEEYFARMASRAALLGTNMQSIEDSGKAFKDFEQMAENMGVMSQLFGAGFADGLKSLTDMRMMYETGDILGLQEHITKQTAKTLFYEDGILKSKLTGNKIYQSQIEAAATASGLDKVTQLRALKSAKMLEMFNDGKVKINKESLEIAGASVAQQELLTASSYDYSLALFSALREKKKLVKEAEYELDDQGKQVKLISAAVYERFYTEKQITDLLSKRGKEGADARAKLLKEGTEELTRRELIAEEQGNMEQKTLAAMLDMEIAVNAMTMALTTGIEKVGEGLSETELGKLKKQILSIATETSNGIAQGIREWSEDKTAWENVKHVLTLGAKKGVIAGVEGVTMKDLEGKGFFEVMEHGMVKALGGKPGEDGVGGMMATKFVNKLEELIPQLAEIFAKVFKAAAAAMTSTGLEGKVLYESDEGSAWLTPAQIEAIEKGGPEPWDDPNLARGWAGGRHTAIVGEAGTEVGITRSALRELSSAGIPGYGNGFVGAATNTQGLFAGAGTVPERGRRQAAAFGAGEEYRDRIRRTEQAFLGIEYNTGQLEKGQPWWVKLMVNGLKDKGVMDSVLNKIRELQVKLLSEDIKQTALTQAGNALLGGIGSGLDAASKVLQAGGSGKQAREALKRAAIGGFVRDISASFGGTADKGYLQNQQTLGALFAAKGRVFSRPSLAVVGEGGANEVVIPTERIRKGLPINAGVAKELASIGVPGFEDGVVTGGGGPSLSGPVDMPGSAPKLGDDVHMGVRDVFAQNWQSGVATAGLSFMNAYMQTGDSGYAAGQAAGSALGLGIQMGISAIPIPGAAIVGAIVGPLIGAKIGGWLGKKFMYKPKYEKHQKAALKNVEDLVASQGIFMHGQPPGIKSQIDKGMLGSRKEHPSDTEKTKMIKMFANSPVLRYGFQPGASPSQLLGLLAGQVGSTADELSMYKRYNNTFYGTPMAKGGIVTRPTSAVIGEAGPEAVIPLDQYDGYASRQQKQDQKDIITELRKSNQQMQTFIKNIGDAKTVLQVDGRILAETVGESMFEIASQ